MYLLILMVLHNTKVFSTLNFNFTLLYLYYRHQRWVASMLPTTPQSLLGLHEIKSKLFCWNITTDFTWHNVLACIIDEFFLDKDSTRNTQIYIINTKTWKLSRHVLSFEGIAAFWLHDKKFTWFKICERGEILLSKSILSRRKLTSRDKFNMFSLYICLVWL